jgi:photosystem II stability/assembly factor-like uncharacterized protein
MSSTLLLLTFIVGCGEADGPVDPGNGAGEIQPLEFSRLNPTPVRGEFRAVHSAGGTHVAVGADGIIAVRPAGESEWRNVTSPTVEDLTAVRMQDAQFGLVVGADGGWKTDDGGRTWRRADEVRGMLDVELHGGRGVMAGGSKVLRSFDVSEWNTNTLDEFDFRDLDFTASGLLYAVGLGTFARSQDGGDSWSSATGPPDIDDLAHVAFIDNVLGVVAQPQRIWHTSDGGITWDRTLILTSDLRSLQLDDDGIGFALTADREVYKTTDAGRSWTLEATDFTDPFMESMFALGESEWLFVGEQGFVALTDDGGGTLDIISSAIRFSLAEPVFATPSIGLLLGFPQDARPLIGRTTDGGLSWQFEPSLHASPKRLELLGPELGVLMDAGSLFAKTTDQGLTWSDASPIAQSGMSFNGLELLDARTWLACGDNLTIMRTEDAGQTWGFAHFDLESGNPLFDLDFFPGTAVVLAINPDGLMRSEDGGQTWGDLELDLSWGGGRRIVCLGEQTAISAFLEIVRTTDQGRTWNTVLVPGADIQDLAFVDELRGIAVDSRGVHYETLDGGLSWRSTRAAFNFTTGVAFRDASSTVTTGEDGSLVLGLRP